MKNATQIINILQNKPQFSRLEESKCIKTLKSSLLPTIQKNIKHSYIYKNTLYFVLTTKLAKLDIDNIINNIKMILNSPMILNSKKFTECLDVQIDDIKVYTDHKPKKNTNLFTTTSHLMKYKERATGDLNVSIKDKKLQTLTQDIFEIIRERDTSTI